jgi:hypothetical protein
MQILENGCGGLAVKGTDSGILPVLGLGVMLSLLVAMQENRVAAAFDMNL